MSVKTETADQTFRDWKRDLDRRADEWVASRPKQLPAGNTGAITLVPVSDGWGVWRSGCLVKIFYGDNAWIEADKLRHKMLESNHGLTQS